MVSMGMLASGNVAIAKYYCLAARKSGTAEKAAADTAAQSGGSKSRGGEESGG